MPQPTFNEDMIQYTKEVHRKVQRNFPTRPVIALGKNAFWCIDLNDMTTYQKQNDGKKYIMVIEDLFTRKCWAYAIEDKKPATIIHILKNLFTEVGHPSYIWTDKGGEFYNNDMTEKILKPNNIIQYSVYGQSKAAPVERLNQTLKHIMFKILTRKQNHKWLEILDDVVDTYNTNIHSVIKMTPDFAYDHPDILMEEMKKKTNLQKPKRPKRRPAPKFKVGDMVRLSRTKHIFEKGYEENWTREVFMVCEVLNTNPYTYKITDQRGAQLEGSFYEQELEKSKLANFGLVEEVLETKTNKKTKVTWELIKWLGYSSKFNSWEPKGLFTKFNADSEN